jgi:hypothetical protein
MQPAITPKPSAPKRKKNGALSASAATLAPKRKKARAVPYNEKVIEQTARGKGAEKDPKPVTDPEKPSRDEEMPPGDETYEDLKKEEEKNAQEMQEVEPMMPEPPFDFLQPFNPRMVDSQLTRGWTIALFGESGPDLPLCGVKMTEFACTLT